MAEGTILEGVIRFVLFATLALLGPALGLFRLLRIKVDPALILPVGLVQTSLLYFVSLRVGLPWLFVFGIAILDLVALVSMRGLTRAPGAQLRGMLLPLAGTLVVFALAEYPLNRVGPRGEFIFDNVVPEDSAFPAGLAWELSVSYPPDVPGLSEVPLGYHLGLHLVRAAARRWAGIHPYDLMSRFEITIVALGLIVAFRETARRLGAPPFAIALAGFVPLATDCSFLFFRYPSLDLWINATDSSLLFSLAHANSSIAAILISLGVWIALERFIAAEGRGYLVLAALLGAAVPHFKVFVGAQYLFGLLLATVLTRRVRVGLLLGLPAALGLILLATGQGGTNMEVRLDPLLIVQKFRATLDLGAVHGLDLLIWTLIWIVAGLGVRLFGFKEAFRSLLSGKAAAIGVAGMALLGWPLGLLFRVTPLEFPGRPPYNEAWYFIEQSAPFLALFAAIALERLPIPRVGLIVLLSALALSSTVQFALAKRAISRVSAPPEVVEAMMALEKVTVPNEVVLVRPEPRRYPPPPMVLIGRRVPYARFIPYLYQVAPPPVLRQRIETVRRFFNTDDPQEALAVARELHARYVCLFGEEEVAFRKEEILRLIYEKEKARVYEIVGPRKSS